MLFIELVKSDVKLGYFSSLQTVLALSCLFLIEKNQF